MRSLCIIFFLFFCSLASAESQVIVNYFFSNDFESSKLKIDDSGHLFIQEIRENSLEETHGVLSAEELVLLTSAIATTINGKVVNESCQASPGMASGTFLVSTPQALVIVLSKAKLTETSCIAARNTSEAVKIIESIVYKYVKIIPTSTPSSFEYFF